MMRYCIPEYRLPKDVLNKEIEEIRAVGVEIRTNSPVERLEDLFEEGYDAILVACGAWQKSKMEIEGEYFAVDGISFLKAVNSGERPKVGKRVIVVGGGNTAVDAARSCVRLGASDVCIVYRRTREEMPASDEEVQAALEEGVRLEFLAAPVQIQKREGDFTLLCRRMKLGPKDASGRPVPVPVEGSEFAMDCDTVISAIGQSVRIPSLFGLRIVEGRVEADPNTLETGVRGVFAAGDAVTGPSSIIEAIAQGRRAASSIDKFLGGDGEIDEVLAQGESAASYEVTMAKTHRPYMPTIPLGRRLCSFECVELGYGPSAGVKEASRCLDCDLRRFSVEVDGSACKDCGYCAEVCRLEVFSHANYFNERGYRPYVAVHPERCIGCLACFYACPDFAISVVRRR
jgi:NADPH-dependent glutamate synthase beta subunit-like oxidoreductase